MRSFKLELILKNFGNNTRGNILPLNKIYCFDVKHNHFNHYMYNHCQLYFLVDEHFSADIDNCQNIQLKQQ